MQTEIEVPFFDYPSVFTSEEEELIGLFREVGRRGEITRLRGVDRPSAVASCTGRLKIYRPPSNLSEQIGATARI